MQAGNIYMAHNARGEADVDIRYDQLIRRGITKSNIIGNDR